MANSSVTAAANTTCLLDEEFLTIMMPPALTILLILAVSFNSLALWIFCFHVKKKIAIDILMINLCVGDLLFSLTYPIAITYYSNNHWIFGNFMCKLQAFIVYTTVLASVFFLTCISNYRCYMIVKPFQSQIRITKKCTIVLSVLIWLLAGGLMSTSFFMVNVFELNGKLHCMSFNEENISNTLLPSTMTLFVLGFVIPCGSLLVSTILIQRKLASSALTSQSQQKGKHAVKMMVVVFSIFIICFLPSPVTRFWIATAERNNCPHFQKLCEAFYSSVLCLYLNGILNPIVYYFAGTKYRSRLTKAIKSWKCCKGAVAVNSNESQ
uniref:lysophosphatidic acid receptor 4-like n=1 Tax=Pristiophorus japonicus TaxID=55135 RepID=UPI00398EF57E